MLSPDDRETPLGEVRFLARSANRVTVLDTLTRGPSGRRALEEETGVARATLGRILDDLVDRGWVVEDDRQYEATELGAYVSRELGSLLDRLAAVPALNAVAEWLPPGGFGFDLGRLADATVVRSTKHDALAPTNHIARHVREADWVRCLTYSVLPGVMDACWRGTVDGGLRLETVLEQRALDGFGANPELIEQADEMAASGQFELYIYPGEIPSTVFVVDEAVLLCLSGGEGAPLAVVESDDEAVRTWAEALIDDHRDDSERLDPSLFTV